MMRRVLNWVVVVVMVVGTFVSSPPVIVQAAAQSLSTPYSQNFNSLGNSGINISFVDDSTLPGWYSTDGTYDAGNGSSTTGTLYSFGTTGSGERALGSVASGGSGVIRYGLRLINDTGAEISGIRVSYTGEQWRDGGNSTPVAQTLAFSYKIGTNLTSLTIGTWTNYLPLDFTSPVYTNTAGPLDGNAQQNRTLIDNTLIVSIPIGQEILLRWTDVNDTGNDHGLGIDDISVTSINLSDSAPSVVSTTPANGTSNIGVKEPIDIFFSEAVTLIDPWYTLLCDGSVISSTPAGSGDSFTISPDDDLPFSSNCILTIDHTKVTDLDTYDPPDSMVEDFILQFTTEAENPTSCNGIYISEYVEGSGDNKFIEIFNGTGTTVDLGGYKLENYTNGSTTPTYTYNLSGSLVNGDVAVVANSNGNAYYVGLADMVTNSSMMGFNGDDAIALRTAGDIYVDIIGQIGVDPGTQWGTDPISTEGATIRRKITIVVGDSNGSNAFIPATEWDGYVQDTMGGLGSHLAACAGDIPPFVASTVPANNASGVSVDAQLTVNFNEPVTVSGSWFNISCTASGTHTAAVSGGPSSYTLAPSPVFTNPEACTVTIYSTQVADQDGTANPMTSNYQWSFTVGTAPAPCSTIPLIQGSSNASTCLGHRSNITGCVTGVTATGFYFQDVSGDGNPATSDGMFAYYYSSWTNPANLQPGDLVNVSGNVTEYYNTTEFAHNGSDALTVTKTGTCTVPAAVTINPITDPAADPMTLYEQYEGMRVKMSFNGWVTGPTKRYLSRYLTGDPEIVFVDYSSSIPANSRVFHDQYPGYQGLQYISGGLGFNLPDLDFGDGIAGTDISGVLGYQFDKYTLLVDAIPALTLADNPDVSDLEPVLDPLKREFDVCFYNVENLFDHINDGAGDWGDWAPGYPTPGTPAGQAAYQAHLDETAAVLVDRAEGCMIIGVQEMEGKQAVYNALAAALNAHPAAAGYTWTAIYVESGDSRDISQGFLYRNDVALLSGPTPVSGAPYSTWVTDSTLDFVRVPVSAKFRILTGTATQTDIIVYGLHFKSKSSSTLCSLPDCTDRREKEAADLRDILKHHQGVGEFAIAGGDFNDYINSTPIGILNAASEVQSLWMELPADQRYSYIFSGESEVLDHVYITSNLKAISGATWAHIFSPVHANADFPSTEHASDHDPLRAVFSFYVDNGAGQPGADLTDLPLSYDLAWHKSPRTLWLGSSVDEDTVYGVGADNETDTGIQPLMAVPWKAGNTVQVLITIGGTGTVGWLSGWFDWNMDGQFGESEKAVNQQVSPGEHTINLFIPTDAQVGNGSWNNLNMRFRLYESAAEPAVVAPEREGGAQPTAASAIRGVVGGEVEDTSWSVSPTALTLLEFRARPKLPIGSAVFAWAIFTAILAAAYWLKFKRNA